MPHGKPAYINDVDRLIAETPLEQVLSHFGQPLPKHHGSEHRMACVFEDACSESSYGSLTVNAGDSAKRIYCHSCGVRGNLLTLLWGLAKHEPPSGGRLRGNEFREAVQLLLSVRVDVPAATDAPAQKPPKNSEKERPRNVPLKNSENERARQLTTLHEQFQTEAATMSPPAAAYFRSRPWLTPELASKWRMGYLPQSAKGLLRGRIVYSLPDEHGDVLSYFGRDPAYEEKRADWERRARNEKSKPMKHRFVKGFHRGLELYGQQAERLRDPATTESLQTIGLVVVEGPNDVIRLDTLNVAAVGLCSNKATEEQVEKLVRFARRLAGGRIVLLPDTDPEGEDGCKELLWQLHQHDRIRPVLGWSAARDRGRWRDRQPESLTVEEWGELRQRLTAGAA